MPIYGPKKVVCPKCKKTHTIMYGDVYYPGDPAFLCEACKPKISDLYTSLYDWLFGSDNHDGTTKSDSIETKRKSGKQNDSTSSE